MATIQTYTAIPYTYDNVDKNFDSFYPTGPAENAYDDETSGTYATPQGRTGVNYATNPIYTKWGFDLSEIPNDAIIDSVSVKAKCYATVPAANYWMANQTGIQLCCGDYATGLRGDFAGMAVRSTIYLLEIDEDHSGSWTRADLDDLWLVTVHHSNGASGNTPPRFRLYGATLTVKFHSAIEYTITANTYNCTSEPYGTQSAGSGTYNRYKIYPNSGYMFSQIIDNGVDVTSNAQQKVDIPEFYSVSQDELAMYGFDYQDPYYTATNSTTLASSFARCTVGLDLPMNAAFVNVYVINNPTGNDAWGLISQMDGSLSDSTTSDSTYKWSGQNNKSANEQLIQFADVTAGIHQFDIKYRKGTTTAENNWFRFRIEIVLAAQYPADIYYEYIVEDIQGNHTLDIYCVRAANYKIKVACSPGGTVSNLGENTIQNGNYFQLRIYPDTNFQISHVTQNSALVSYNQIDDYYVYTIPVVQNDANLFVTFTSGDSRFFIKDSGTWTQVIQAYRKVNGSWEEVLFAEVGDPNAKYIRKN